MPIDLSHEVCRGVSKGLAHQATEGAGQTLSEGGRERQGSECIEQSVDMNGDIPGAAHAVITHQHNLSIRPCAFEEIRYELVYTLKNSGQSRAGTGRAKAGRVLIPRMPEMVPSGVRGLDMNEEYIPRLVFH